MGVTVMLLAVVMVVVVVVRGEETQCHSLLGASDQEEGGARVVFCRTQVRHLWEIEPCSTTVGVCKFHRLHELLQGGGRN